MSANAKTILRDLGLTLHVPGVMALASLPVCFIFDEQFAAGAFVWTASVSIVCGQVLYWVFRRAEPTRLSQAMIVAAGGWLLVPLLGAMPFVLIAIEVAEGPSPLRTVVEFERLWNAIFESFSGFTGTGLTMALRPSELPHCLQWWRSFMEWVGGVGVILLMLAILRPTAGADQLYYSEGREERIYPSALSTVRTIWWIYLMYTGLSVLALRAVGMTWWSALNHGMTGISTGGFGITDYSIADFGPAVRMVLVPIMIAGAVSFAVHFQALTRARVTALWRDSQHRALWLLLVVGTFLLAAENRWASGEFHWLDSVFQCVAALTTAGFQTADLHNWSPTAQLLLSLGMIIGGAAGSTVGGLKLMRLVLLHKGLVWRFRRVGRAPHEVMRFELDGKSLTPAEADRLTESAGVLAVLWATVLWLAILVLVHFVPSRYTLSEVILEIASAQSNVGLSTGITHPDLPWPGKLTLIACMWLGRLEIVPALLLIVWLARSWQRRGRRQRSKPLSGDITRE